MKVSDFAANHPTLDRICRPLGMYHVYTSVWFSAIYLLLLISLSAALFRASSATRRPCAVNLPAFRPGWTG